MNSKLFVKLAYDNIRKNIENYLPFLITCISMVTMFFMIETMRIQVVNAEFAGALTMENLLFIAKIVCGIVATFVIIYANKFLIKKRNKEFGLYSVLGMEKKHIISVIFYEIILVGLFSIVFGIIIGIIFARLMYMILMRFIRLGADIEFTLAASAFSTTISLFMGILVFIIIVNGLKIISLKPIEIMRLSNYGDKEPKTRYFMTLIGIILIGIGYYLILNTEYPFLIIENRLSKYVCILIATICVVIGTYIIFVDLSIVILKRLKNNKRFFYHKNHFVTISDMMYRMRQNAMGLATICILSTGTIIAIAASVALYVGVENVINNRYQNDVELTFGVPDDYLKETLFEKLLKEYDVELKNLKEYRYLLQPTYLKGNCFNQYNVEQSQDTESIDIKFILLDDYNKMYNKNETLRYNEVILYTSKENLINDKTVKFGSIEYIVKDVIVKDIISSDLVDVVAIVKGERDSLSDLSTAFYLTYTSGKYFSTKLNMEFDIEGNNTEKKNFVNELREDKLIMKYINIIDIYSERQALYSAYGSLLYIGIYIGIILLGVTVIIIYYKQLSEGYDNRERFVIMKNIGMSKREIRRVINNPIRVVFFLPILLAISHVTVAFNIVKDMLIRLDLSNEKLVMQCMLTTILIFIFVYTMVYVKTVKVCYNITFKEYYQ